ncbi:hypothetical protein SAMN00790413_04371 [Deinococcus hopiensis KR-140]|uniref:Uncharacterized protein n=1 Tax=Deinococcus hopiensis KR-140 TaxID=695939 RepID=A0A1W1UQJ4_9DEIO|nr:hypothetical protein SAMN00790413_04371 [Deinococcus hopiensis KR-140]
MVGDLNAVRFDAPQTFREAHFGAKPGDGTVAVGLYVTARRLVASGYRPRTARRHVLLAVETGSEAKGKRTWRRGTPQTASSRLLWASRAASGGTRP